MVYWSIFIRIPYTNLPVERRFVSNYELFVSSDPVWNKRLTDTSSA